MTLKNTRVKLNGVRVGEADAINLVDSGSVTITAVYDAVNDEMDLSFAGTGGAGAGVDVEEDNGALGTATTIDFSTGLDVSFAGGEADITVDTGELTVLTALAFGGNVV